MKLRAEIMRFRRDDGGVDLLDLVLERLVSLGAEDARALDEESPELMARLEKQFLLEGPVADSMRQAAWSARARAKPREAPAPSVPAIDWEEARALPEIIAPAWRHPERLRRLAEERAAGRRYLPLPGFLDEPAAARISAAAAALAFSPMRTDLVHASRHLLEPQDLPEWRALMESAAVKRLLGAVLGVELPERLFINAWRLERGDFFAVHPDGRLYRGTLSLGLCERWSAADGGAIAFGDPTPGGFVVRERWLPHLGDALLFAPAADTWHAVEPVISEKVRLSLTGWWTANASA
jgi:2OG-Fe(II) oxygenase superfamily